MMLCTDHVICSSGLALDVVESTQAMRRVVHWTVSNRGSEIFHGVIRLRLDWASHFQRPWVMVPGYFYGENRRIGQRITKLYPRFDPACVEPAEMTSSWWDFAADRTAAPLVFLHEHSRCWALACDPHVRYEGQVISEDPEPQVGLGFGQHLAGGGYARVSVPACEEPFTYNNGPCAAATIRRLTLPPGASIRGTLHIYAFEADRHGYQRVLEDFDALLRPNHPPADLVPIEPLVRDAVHGIVQGHYHAQGNYFLYSRPFDPVQEQIANGHGFSMQWHQMMVGFVNGLPVCHGLLRAAQRLGDAETREVACRVADRICREGRSPSGLFWADYVPPRIVTDNGTFVNPLHQGRDEWGSGWLKDARLVHSRTIADAADNLAAMITLMRRHEPDAPSLKLWTEALASNLQAALAMQLSSGSFGQFYDAMDGRVVKEDGCGGLLWIPAMIRAIKLDLGGTLSPRRLHDAVVQAGDAYAPYVRRESIWGAPEDNDSPTSEDGQNAVMAYCDLYELTGETRFLDLAVIAADWMLSFRKMYNQQLPEQSLMGRYDLRSRGGDYASTSNNHLHVFEVLCTGHLARLSQWTGNDYYRRRARDHWAFACQYLSREDGMYNGFRGAMAEQFYWCNWGSWAGKWRTPAYHRQKGNMAAFTAIWCANVLLLAAPEAQAVFYGVERQDVANTEH